MQLYEDEKCFDHFEIYFFLGGNPLIRYFMSFREDPKFSEHYICTLEKREERFN